MMCGVFTEASHLWHKVNQFFLRQAIKKQLFYIRKIYDLQADENTKFDSNSDCFLIAPATRAVLTSLRTKD